MSSATVLPSVLPPIIQPDIFRKELPFEGLTFLSYAAGQDSTSILVKFIDDPLFREKYAPDRLLVLMSDTGAEHQFTYDHVRKTEKLCDDHGIEFHFITSDMGYHTPAWPDLYTPQSREDGTHKQTLVLRGVATCTHQLKLVPLMKFLNVWLNRELGYQFKVDRRKNMGGKRAISQFYNDGGTIDLLLGFAKGEERRARKAMKIQEREHSGPDEWKRVIRRRFPLIEEGLDRQACISLNEEFLGYEVMPSNCVICPYMTDFEMLWAFRNERDKWDLWVEAERRKVERFKNDPNPKKRNGVHNSHKYLPERIRTIVEKHGHLTDEQLWRMKKTHSCQTNPM